jgi:hypothetical protein
MVVALSPSEWPGGWPDDRGLAIFLSGRDYVAREFDDACKASAEWRKALDRADLDITRFADADHTFSGPGEAQAVAEATHAWLQARGLAR